MSTLTLAEARAAISTSLTDPELQARIDSEELWLARRIGPLEGERTETFRTLRLRDILRLQRPTDAVEVTDNGTAITDLVMRRNGWRVGRTLGAWLSPVAVTYTPNDEAEVKRVVIELLRLSLALSLAATDAMLYDSEHIGQYSYQRADGLNTPHAIRRALVRSLREPPEPESHHVLGSLEKDQRVTVIPQ